MENRAIGVFDSGVGGLTVLKEIIKILPHENIIYYGDTARTPYGTKSRETILGFSRQIIKFLIANNVKLIVIACNTVSANCFCELKKEFSLPIIEVLSCGVNAVIQVTKNKSIGIIGTQATIKSQVYEKCITKKNHNIKIFSKSCPLFVPLAEEGWTNNKIAYETSEIYLDEFKDKNIDTLLLACTHYPLFIECIKKNLPGKKIVNPAEFTAIKVKKYLSEKKILRSKNNSEVIFYMSDEEKKFHQMCNKILEKDYPPEKFIHYSLD